MKLKGTLAWILEHGAAEVARGGITGVEVADCEPVLDRIEGFYHWEGPAAQVVNGSEGFTSRYNAFKWLNHRVYQRVSKCSTR